MLVNLLVSHKPSSFSETCKILSFNSFKIFCRRNCYLNTMEVSQPTFSDFNQISVN